MSLKAWFEKNLIIFKEDKYPVFRDDYKKVGLFWALPKLVRIILLLGLTIIIFILGVISFFTGMNAAVLVFSFWSHNLAVYGLLGIAGMCRVWIAVSSFLFSIIALLSLIVWSWSRAFNDQADRERRMRNEARFDDAGWFSRAFWIIINQQLNFFGKPRPWFHVLVFFISLVAFFVKG